MKSQIGFGIALSLGLLASTASGDVGPDGPMRGVARAATPAKAPVPAAAGEAEAKAALRPGPEGRYAAPQPDPAPPSAKAPEPGIPVPAKTTVWVPGRLEAVQTVVWEEVEQREVWIAPIYVAGYDHAACRPTRTMVRQGRWEYQAQPMELAQREVLKWSPGYEQTVGTAVAHGRLESPASSPARAPRNDSREGRAAAPAPRATHVAEPRREKPAPSKRGFDLSAGWSVPADTKRR